MGGEEGVPFFFFRESDGVSPGLIRREIQRQTTRRLLKYEQDDSICPTSLLEGGVSSGIKLSHIPGVHNEGRVAPAVGAAGLNFGSVYASSSPGPPARCQLLPFLFWLRGFP